MPVIYDIPLLEHHFLKGAHPCVYSLARLSWLTVFPSALYTLQCKPILAIFLSPNGVSIFMMSDMTRLLQKGLLLKMNSGNLLLRCVPSYKDSWQGFIEEFLIWAQDEHKEQCKHFLKPCIWNVRFIVLNQPHYFNSLLFLNPVRPSKVYTVHISDGIIWNSFSKNKEGVKKQTWTQTCY